MAKKCLTYTYEKPNDNAVGQITYNIYLFIYSENEENQNELAFEVGTT